jgi:hypothetical protein
MKREVVQDFLNLPGIAGVALMDGRSRPYFCGVNQTLNFQQKEALAQGIQQVVETTPADFQFFEFQFTGHQVYIYKLDHGIILLVLTSGKLVHSSYVEAVELLKLELEEDITNAIATFRLLAGNITLSDQNYWKRRSDTSPITEIQPPLVEATPPPPQPMADNGSPNPSRPTVPAPTAAVLNLKDLLVALNHLSQFTTQYLGTTVIVNYWKSSRPAVEWLNNFQIDRAAHITFSGTLLNGSQALSEEQHQWLREWVVAFIDRCSKVIRDFPAIIKQTALNEEQKAYLLPSDF